LHAANQTSKHAANQTRQTPENETQDSSVGVHKQQKNNGFLSKERRHSHTNQNPKANTQPYTGTPGSAKQ
jgi:hypothetical protein